RDVAVGCRISSNTCQASEVGRGKGMDAWRAWHKQLGNREEAGPLVGGGEAE
ncbi:hypothetical protein E2562_015496, partial [Oryza meyeriana var. granulata]